MSRGWIATIVSAQVLLGGLCAGVQAEVFVYPAKGQSQDQQGKDEYECSKWAKSQSGVDPSAPAQANRGERVGGTASGAAKGALVGAGIGAIAGDAGKGAAIGAVGGGVAGRRGSINREQQGAQQERNAYDRAFAACVEGRGYTAK